MKVSSYIHVLHSCEVRYLHIDKYLKDSITEHVIKDLYLTNHVGSITRHITPLVIHSLGADIHTHK